MLIELLHTYRSAFDTTFNNILARWEVGKDVVRFPTTNRVCGVYEYSTRLPHYLRIRWTCTSFSYCFAVANTDIIMHRRNDVNCVHRCEIDINAKISRVRLKTIIITKTTSTEINNSDTHFPIKQRPFEWYYIILIFIHRVDI